ncbi:MAG: hypothetical protein E7666_00360 [Ruminococcaceae bacterium]|nr:hypothetical protein [Oscillospiraceae bacterium]
MALADKNLKREEKAILELRELYSQYGYARYKVSKFEEYDLYAYNKSFLVSDNILTFTDTNGKLMALKPDVTLSIVKNIDADSAPTHKVYYNETVYRTSAGSDGFREIMQTGLECIGSIGLYEICEVLMLAERSLARISEDSILDLSHMGFVGGLLTAAGIPDADRSRVLGYIGNKNTAELRAYGNRNQINEDMIQAICKMTELYAPLQVALPVMEPLIRSEEMRKAYNELCEVADVMKRFGNIDRLYLDFSMIQDMRYYNGIVFHGYVNGIPDSVLSGGRYDKLLRLMGKRGGAIGFAVYLDALEQLDRAEETFDADVLLLFDGAVSPMELIDRVEALRLEGKSVRVEQETNESTIRCREVIRMTSNRLGG